MTVTADPLYVAGTDDLDLQAKWLSGYEAGFHDAARLPALRALGSGLFIGLVIGLIIGLLAASGVAR